MNFLSNKIGRIFKEKKKVNLVTQQNEIDWNKNERKTKIKSII